MRHCVGTYSARAVQGHCAIWRALYNDEDGNTHRVTIEVLKSGQIRQCMAYDNRPKPHMAWMEKLSQPLHQPTRESLKDRSASEMAWDSVLSVQKTKEREKSIREAALSHAEVRGVHDLRTRRSGHDIFIQLHVELDDDLLLFRAHEIADEVEALIQNIHPEADVLIHTDPRSLMENVAFR